MRETEKRIKEYKKALPHLREKLAAATMMLLVSVIVMTASRISPVSLSRAVTVTVTADSEASPLAGETLSHAAFATAVQASFEVIVKLPSPDTASNDRVVSLRSNLASGEAGSQATATAATMANIIKIRFMVNLF